MKKILAIICTVAMLLSLATTAFASDWDVVLSQEYTSYDATVEFSVALNKPLEFLAYVNEDAGFDVKYLVEELTKAKYNARVQAEVNQEAPSARMAMAINANVPVNISEDLKFGADMTLYMWIEYDFSSIENAKYNIIVKNPVNGQLLTMDYFAMMEMSGEDTKSRIVEMVKSLDMKEGVEEITALLKSVYEKNAKLEIGEDGYTMTFTNNGLIDTAFDLITGYMNTDYLKSTGVDMSVPDMGGVDMATIQAMVRGLGIFGENDAMVIKAKTDAKGILKETEESVHIDFNIVELVEALGADSSMMFPLTKENSDIDVTMNAKVVYEKVNEKNIVEMPVLTEENSMSLMEALGYSDYEEDYIVPEYEVYQSEYFWDYTQGLMDRGGMYAEMNGFLGSCIWDSDNLTGEVLLGENGDVTMTLTSDNFGTVTVKGNVNSDEYMLNSTKLWARKPFKVVTVYDWDEYEGMEVVYVNMDVLHYILGAKVQSMQTYLLDEDMNALTSPEYYFDIVRPNPAYVPAEYDIYEDVPEFLFDDQAASIGIIGGADGPTKVFVTEME